MQAIAPFLGRIDADGVETADATLEHADRVQPLAQVGLELGDRALLLLRRGNKPVYLVGCLT